MTDTASTLLPDRGTQLSPPDRSEIERAFLAALAQGPESVVEQVAHLLALSRLNAAIPPAAPPQTPLSSDEARLVALSRLAESLSETEALGLYHAADRITNPSVRLLVLTRLALRLPPQHYQAVVRLGWQEGAGLEDPAARAQAMFQLAPLLTLYHDEPATPPALLEIVSLAQAIGNPEARIRSLITLSPYLPQGMRLRVLHRAIDEIDQLHSDNARFNALNTLADRLMPEIEGRALHSAEAIRSPGERARAFTALARHMPMAMRPALRTGALNAIGTIRDEDERAEALMAFAPHLEYVTNTEQFPLLLEHALRIAVGIKRRHLRARALVALSPHLTLDLQGEALAAVHSLSSERERATLLADLAATLPPEMLVASLAVAHSMQSQDARVHALSVLVHYVPEHARDQTLLDALAAANNLPRPYERIVALVGLIDVLPAGLREQTCANALETVRLMKNENASARALGLLAPHLPPVLGRRALEIARGLTNPVQRYAALNGLLPFLVAYDRQTVLPELLAAIEDMPYEYRRARALAEITPLLPDELIPQTIEIVDRIADPFDRVSACVVLISRLPADQGRRILADCWRLIRQIDNGYDAACALSAIAPMLPPAAASDLARAAGMIIGSIMDEYDQASAIALLAPLLALSRTPETGGSIEAEAVPERHAAIEHGIHAALRVADQAQRTTLLAEGALMSAEAGDSEQLFRMWRDVAAHFTTLPLADTLLGLSAFAPVVRRLGGDDALAAVARLMEQC